MRTTLDWDYNNSIIYLNLRNTNTFYKINQTTGNIIWACGEFGNFTLLGANGQPLVGANGLPPSLWYHSHDVKEVAPDVFTMFDNDYDNNTNPDDCHSRMIEVTLNETSMTAYVNWSWEAPTQYWNSYAGATLLLPNGDYIGDFGDPTHQFRNPQNQPWNFNNTGAVLVEVNPAGQVVRTFTFPVGCYVYRIEAITNPSVILPPLHHLFQLHLLDSVLPRLRSYYVLRLLSYPNSNSCRYPNSIGLAKFNSVKLNQFSNNHHQRRTCSGYRGGRSVSGRILHEKKNQQP